MAPKQPDLSLLVDTVAARILGAMRAASSRLTELGVRHALVGGLAVGAWGHPRATKDVDFLVGEEAFEHHEGGLVTMKYGVPIQIGGVAIDLLSAAQSQREDSLPVLTAGEVPVVALATLVYLKLRSPRPKDLLDVIELVRAGIDGDLVRSELLTRSPDLVARWDLAVSQAWVGDE